MKALREALQRADNHQLRSRAVHCCQSTGTNLALELDTFFLAVAAAVGEAELTPKQQDAIEREPGTVLRMPRLYLEHGVHKVGYRIRIIDGRYRGVVGFIHAMDHEADTVTIRTGDPADWRAWDARRRDRAAGIADRAGS